MSFYYVIYYNDIPIIVLWNLINTQYITINNINYCNKYFLKFFIMFLNIIKI